MKTLVLSDFYKVSDSLKRHKLSFSVFVVWLFILSALIGMSIGYKEWFIEKTPLNLCIGAVLLFWNFPIDTTKKLLFFLFAFVVGMGVEIVGVKTGLLFGEYYYGENLGAKFMSVPYLIGVYWAVLSCICAAIGKKIGKTAILGALIGAGLMVGLDVCMEQLAHRFDFWHFAGGVAPLRNYITWYLVALALQYLLLKATRVEDYLYSVNLYASQLVFFGVCLLDLFPL